MKIEDDPSIATCACPWCASVAGVPCKNTAGDCCQDRKFWRSHMARLRKAKGILARRSLDGRLSRKAYAKVLNQLGIVAGEISKRMRRGKISLLEYSRTAPALEKEIKPFMKVGGLLKLIGDMPNERNVKP